MDEFIRNAIQQVCQDVDMTDQEKVTLLLRVLTVFLKKNLKKDGHIGS